VDERGWIYVQTWKNSNDEENYFIDLFDADGRYRALLSMKERAFIRKGKMYSIEEDEEGTQIIKRHAVTWNLK